MLYYDVIVTLSPAATTRTSAVLDQSCQDLLNAGVGGFTAATCTSVHRAGVATELTTTPTNALQPAGRPADLPGRYGAAGPVRQRERVTRRPSSRPGRREPRGVGCPGSNATSGQDAWFPSTRRRPPAAGWSPFAIGLPAGQKSYLWFQQWRLLTMSPVRLLRRRRRGHQTTRPPARAVGERTGRTLSTQYGNPWGRQAVLRRRQPSVGGQPADLSSWAGQSVTSSFYLFSDSSVGSIGWFIDDVEVYT